ncbi:uncharacterized protein [Channa argus]|uniref:uncharacterized protein n=1 Tax=Channa argus TaxID=215402 RepID=UPI00352280F4
MLADSNICLHKLASNSPEVMKAFPSQEWAKELKDLDLGADPLPLQRSLGLNWNLQKDSFTFLVSREEKPFPRRGVLSTVNSLYDPLGFAAPITMQGKALIRELCSENCDWDAPLPADKETQWRAWQTSLVDLEKLQIPRQYIHTSLHTTLRRELCVFADASTLAVSAVAYLRAFDEEGQVHVGFCMGKSKLAPRQPHTVPCLELCAAVLAVELADTLLEELDIEIHEVKYYTDSKVVLGYINNTSRRFYMYVANRVARIRKSTNPTQWYFVNTQHNPADHGTRPVPVSLLCSTSWLTGPDFLKKVSEDAPPQPDSFELVEPASDVEIRPLITTFTTKVGTTQLGSHRFKRFSRWRLLIHGVAKLIQKIRSSLKAPEKDMKKLDKLKQAKNIIIRSVQEEEFKEELKSLSKGELVPEHSLILSTGLDVFGPWNICVRRTRSGASENKRWAVMFTCLVTRAVHIEVIESLSTSSFINALRRFVAIRGPVKLFQSDRGTNFVGACKELQFAAEDPELQSYFKDEGCTWKFNPPHSSHMGGVWERMIGVARRILDAMLLKVHTPSLSHEVLTTLMAEVSAIMNGRPLVPISTDPEQPDLLTPGSIFTQKTELVSAPPGVFDPNELHRKQWKQVQCLANSFWKRWRQEYLATLQPRRKWQAVGPNLEIGDVVLLKDSQAKRNEWPVGLIVNTFPGQDNRVRKVEVRVVKGGTPRVYIRPISECVLLIKGT